MAHDDFSRATAQSAANILCSYLASHGLVLANRLAVGICDALALTQMTDIKASARPLRGALAEHGISLKQSNALEVLARVAGHTCYMRAKQATAEPNAAHVVLCTVDGAVRQPQAFASIGETITGMLTTVIELMPSRRQPSFCKISRYPSGFQLEVSQLNAPWFTVQLVKFREDSLNSNSLVPLSVDEDALRLALRKIVASIEQARPATLVLGGAVADALPPWYSAAFHVTALLARTARVVSDERELFLMLDASGCDNLRTKRGDLFIDGREESFRVELVWVDMTGKDAAARSVETASTMKAVFRRYMRYRNALSGSVSEALLAIGGSGSSNWHARASFGAIESLATERTMTIGELASKAGVAFRDVKRLQDFELATPALIVKLALALDAAPSDLLVQRESSLGFAADSGEQFIKMVSGAMAYRSREGNSLQTGDLDDARRVLETAKDIAEIASFESGEFADVIAGSFDERNGRYESMAQELLDDANACGIKLIFSRDVEFVQTGNKAAEDGGYMAMNVLTICAERIDGAISAMWTPIN